MSSKINGFAGLEVTQVAEAAFPTEYGEFRIFGFQGRWQHDPIAPPDEAAVIVMGDVRSGEPPLLRIHSQCLTGDVFHSLRCDCRAQLEISLDEISREGRGLIIYELKEGRGIGLINKLRAYQLQDHGADTVEANERLGFENDLRDYSLPGGILQRLGISSVRLLSNNPDKVNALEAAGIRVAERVPCIASDHESRRDYLATKRDKLGHIFDSV